MNVEERHLLIHFDDLRFGSVRIGDVYQHYKGGLYVIIAVCLLEATKEHLIVYKSLINGVVWCRPKQEFTELVNVEGNNVNRFKRTACYLEGFGH